MTDAAAKALVSTLESFIRIVARDATAPTPFRAHGIEDARENLAAVLQLAIMDEVLTERAIEEASRQ